MKIFGITTVAILAGSTAFAGGMDIAPAPAPVPLAPLPAATPNWTGGYAGLSLGYGTGSAEVEDDEDTTAVDESADIDFDGAIGGVFAGYNYDLGNAVVGAELDLNAANFDLDDDVGSIDEVHRLKLRGGFKAGSALIYGVAGAAYASAEVLGDDFSDTGWLVGLGVDYLVTDNIVAGAEVLYHQFDDFDDTGIDVDATTLQARVAYKF
ncbi:porin family protein [Maribius pontilimi]|uniref:Porin family protein n=1 Tax=Palleronia pontilimi TaxID=1964209 RepID=A0A934MEJ1_9RHOB|nr:outer membrane beta-barrel protein [Palleronia pontilimi]MBJ3763501.1 porin family protein [Palleronia pontilimi]